MTREDAEIILAQAGTAEDEGFPLLECALACAIIAGSGRCRGSCVVC